MLNRILLILVLIVAFNAPSIGVVLHYYHKDGEKSMSKRRHNRRKR